MTADYAVRTSGITRSFGPVTAVDGIDICLAPGSQFGLLGPDGAGKSTLIKMLATVLPVTRGDAEVFGHSVVTAPGRVTPRIGYMPQKFCMYPDLTVAENVEFFATIRGVGKQDRRIRSARLLESMGMAEFTSRRAGLLSGGMKQKLMLATTLMHQPDLLLLDEPTTGVDPVSRREFWSILAELRRGGTTVLVATPYMDEAARCSHIAFMADGRIREQGTMAEIAQLVPGVLLEVAGAPARAALAAVTGTASVLSAHLYGDVVRVLFDAKAPSVATTTLTQTLHKAKLLDAWVTPIEIDMESAYAALANGLRRAS